MKIFIQFALVLFTSLLSSGSYLPTDKFTRIVGGKEATPHSAPYIVSLLYKKPGGVTDYCAGSLISDQWILTAAHCLYLKAEEILVLAGHHDLTSITNTSQIRQAIFHTKHSNFKKIGAYDIGVLQVNEPFEINNEVKTIEISSSLEPTGSVFAFGWGSTTTSTNAKFASKLQTTELSIVGQTYCKSRYSVNVPERINFCAGRRDDGRGTCVGDSGGPVIKDNEQIGIVSWGPISCNSKAGPSVFTNVAYFIPWIHEEIQKRSS